MAQGCNQTQLELSSPLLLEWDSLYIHHTVRIRRKSKNMGNFYPNSKLNHHERLSATWSLKTNYDFLLLFFGRGSWKFTKRAHMKWGPWGTCIYIKVLWYITVVSNLTAGNIYICAHWWKTNLVLWWFLSFEESFYRLLKNARLRSWKKKITVISHFLTQSVVVRKMTV